MPAPDAPITFSDVLRWHGPVGHLLTVAHRRTAGPWNPLWRSPAAREAAATAGLRRPDGTPWGEAPLGSAYTAAGLLIAAAVEHADAGHRLLASSPTSSLALDTMTRAALEAAAQAWWLLDPAIDGRTRVARLYTLRRASASALENTAVQLGLTSAQGYGAQTADLDHLYETTLGLTVHRGPKGGFVDCEGQSAGKYTGRVAAFMTGIGVDPGSGPYAYFCGASHAELWRIQERHREAPAADGITRLVPHAPRALIHTALSASVDAVVHPVDRALHLLGRTAGTAELAHAAAQVRTALTL